MPVEIFLRNRHVRQCCQFGWNVFQRYLEGGLQRWRSKQKETKMNQKLDIKAFILHQKETFTITKNFTHVAAFTAKMISVFQSISSRQETENISSVDLESRFIPTRKTSTRVYCLELTCSHILLLSFIRVSAASYILLRSVCNIFTCLVGYKIHMVS